MFIVTMAILVLALILSAIKRYRFASRMNSIAGLKSLFGLGIRSCIQGIRIAVSSGGMNEVAGRLLESCNLISPDGLFFGWFGTSPALLVSSPEMAEVILRCNKNIQKGFNYVLLEPWIGKGLITNKGESWRTRRKLLTPVFHYNVLQQFFSVMHRNADVLIQKLEQQMLHNIGIVDDIRETILLFATDVICEAAMGIRINAQSDSEAKFVKAISEIGKIQMVRSSSPWLYLDFIYYNTEPGLREKQLLNTIHGTRTVIVEKRMR